MCRRKLTLEQFEEITAKLEAGQSQASLAREYRVSKHIIYKINTKRADGISLWLWGYRRDQQRAALIAERAAKKGRLEPPRPTGGFEKCKHGLMRAPCIACWAERKGKPRDGHRFDDTESTEIALELSAEMERRRTALRERGGHGQCS
jgi:hypothetical protein